MATKFGFMMVALLLVGAVFLFGCTQQAPQKNESAPESPVVNESTGPAINQTQEENLTTTPVIPLETRKAILNTGFSSSASSPIGKGLDSFNVVLGKIEIHGSEGWTTVSDNATTVDLAAVSGGKEPLSSANTTLGNYDKIRMNIISAESVYVTSTAIPGVVSEKKATPLTIPSSIVEIPLSLNMTNESETYSVTIVFDINQVDPAAVESFDASSATTMVKMYSQCMPDCVAGCAKTNDVYKECLTSCALDKSRDCDMNATTTCMVDCNCPNNVCYTGDQEQCKLDCLKTRKSDNSTCKMAINASCIDDCMAKPSFVACTESCMGAC
ncbi:Uncharacterised protein [uncultured archaeon]|nr:Uncharacterised protein [uncultured archaeon]